MMRFVALLSLLWLVGCRGPISTAVRTDEILKMYHDEPEQVLVAAHRGGHLLAPENSLAAIDEAVEAGAHIVELDVRLTADQELILMHDRTIDRTTTGQGAVDSLSWEELRAFPLLHQGQPTAQQPPTLREALLHAKDRILVDLDVKVRDLETARRIYRLIQELDMERQIIYFLNDLNYLPELHAMNPQIRIMPLARSMEDLWTIVGWQLTDIIHINESFAGEEALELIRNNGIRLWANSLGVRDESARKDISAFGDFFLHLNVVNIVQTDEPALLIKYLISHDKTLPPI